MLDQRGEHAVSAEERGPVFELLTGLVLELLEIEVVGVVVLAHRVSGSWLSSRNPRDTLYATPSWTITDTTRGPTCSR